MSDKTLKQIGVSAPTMVCSDCGFHIPLDVAMGPGDWKTLGCPNCRLVIHLCRGTVSEHRFR
jgi:hypothetical protein